MSRPGTPAIVRERRRRRERDRHAERGRRRHRDLPVAARDHDHDREADGHQDAQRVAPEAARSDRAADHDGDAERARRPSRSRCAGGSPRASGTTPAVPPRTASWPGTAARGRRVVCASARMKADETIARHTATRSPARPTLRKRRRARPGRGGPRGTRAARARRRPRAPPPASADVASTARCTGPADDHTTAAAAHRSWPRRAASAGAIMPRA